jgi:predicted protein tyrosine phosphatase
MNILFVCTLNKARSVTAAKMYRRTPGIAVRSAGISDRSQHQLVEDDLAWADRVITFESKHEKWIRETFTGDFPEIIDVGIPDHFTADAPELVHELMEVLTPILGKPKISVNR